MAAAPVKTAAPAPSQSETWIRLLADLALPVGLLGCVVVVLVPLPPAILDVFLSANIALSVIMLLTAVQVKTPLEFSAFPTLLLATTLGRLVLNVATTRAILTGADTEGLLAGGHVVKAFGEFVAGDRLVVGVVLFAILVVIQFVVITKGATRISEVAARFALDGLPGRQMAVDADLNAGLITDVQARERRTEIARQTDFYAAMDGASKFVRGDAVAGLIITAVNIVGGLLIGVFEAGMPIAEAASVFSRLTIGDGLVSQTPALLIALAAGILTTRSGGESDLSSDVAKQAFGRVEGLTVCGVFLLLLTGTALPKLPLLALGSIALGGAYWLHQRQQKRAAEKEVAPPPAAPQEPRIEDLLNVDPMELEIGVGLIRLVDHSRGGDLLARVQQVRQSMAGELGIVLPKVRIRDNVRIDRSHYRIKLSDAVIAEGEVQAGKILALDWGGARGDLPGRPTTDPALGLPAVWIDPGLKEQAERQGYTLTDAAGVLATHLTQVIRRHSDELLSREATKHLLESLKRTAPAVVEELIPNQLKLGDVQRVLQLLLREGVPIRNLAAILETLGDHAGRTKQPEELVEAVRSRLARTLCARYRDPSKRLYVVTLDPHWEDRIAAATASPGARAALAPSTIEEICRLTSSEIEKLEATGRPAIVVVAPRVRSQFKQLTSSRLPDLVVFSYAEITPDTRLEALGMVRDAATLAKAG